MNFSISNQMENKFFGWFRWHKEKGTQCTTFAYKNMKWNLARKYHWKLLSLRSEMYENSAWKNVEHGKSRMSKGLIPNTPLFTSEKRQLCLCKSTSRAICSKLFIEYPMFTDVGSFYTWNVFIVQKQIVWKCPHIGFIT